MIDWLNFVIWVVFMFAGIVLFFKLTSLNKYEEDLSTLTYESQGECVRAEPKVIV